MAKQTAPKSDYKHVEYIDVNDDGVLEEVAVVKRWGDGSISYIDVASLDQIDRGRLKKIITGVHADKYELWELLGQARLSNGMNALDFFHSNLVKIKRAQGSKNTSLYGSLAGATADDGVMPGTGYTDTRHAEVAAEHPRSMRS